MSKRSRGANSDENKLLKVIYNQITLLIAVVATTVSVINWVRNPVNVVKDDVAETKTSVALIQKDINTINTNHLTHIQAELEKKTKIDDEQTKELVEFGNTLTEILTILKQKELNN